MKVEETKQERLAIKNFCLAAVALTTPKDPPKGRLSNIEFPANTHPTES